MIILNETNNRLNEADFFLNKLKEHKDVFPDFDYFLNAFISSARSVLWIMKNEYGSNEAWKKWYNNKPTSESEDILLKGITKMRNRSLKQAPLKIRKFPMISLGSETVDLYEELHKYISKHGKNKKYSLTIKEKDNVETREILVNEDILTINGKLNIYDTVEEFKESNIIDKCEEYLLWLKLLVEECTELFNKQDN